MQNLLVSEEVPPVTVYTVSGPRSGSVISSLAIYFDHAVATSVDRVSAAVKLLEV